ncbi:hypothetical protein M3Y95_00091300 [Aphelenchoides besseyi]|nr:hypothetical protein M3Y95_00091300 [Aphelenchoides besseyi]
MKADGQLQVSQLEVPSFNYFGCFDGFLYSIAYKNGYDSQKMKAQPIDLVKVSISSGEQVRERTFNWKVIKEYGFMRSIESAFYTCCVGQKLFLNYSSPHAKEGLLSLDLDTRKWKLNFALNDYECMYSNGDQALIVARYQEYYDCSDIYRYVFNHPDKLSDLVWLRLKRIFDARPEAYEFILSQLPSNFKQKCPFPQL